MFKRSLESAIHRARRTFPAVLVTGARQAGKTTLLRMGWGESHRYTSLENPDTRKRAREDPVGFLRDHSPPIILDEIQYAPDLLSYIKSAIDEDRTPGAWLLTGSQNFSLMQGISQSLAGRVAVLELLPFSIGEAIGRPQGEETIDDLIGHLFEENGGETPTGIGLGDWLLRGGYPEIRAKAEVDRNLWCAAYIQTYLERDVRQIVNVGDLNTFDRFLRLVAARTGQILNLSDLARDTGISSPTAKKWISALETGGQVFLLYPYFKNFGKRVIKSPKIYFMDTALATFLMGLHAEEPILRGPAAGALVETAVVTAWVKAFRHRGEPPSLYYWRSRDGLEVDLVIDRNGRLYPIEIKAASTITSHHAKGLTSWRDLTRIDDLSGVVVADVPHRLAVTPGVSAVPWWIV